MCQVRSGFCTSAHAILDLSGVGRFSPAASVNSAFGAVAGMPDSICNQRIKRQVCERASGARYLTSSSDFFFKPAAHAMHRLSQITFRDRFQRSSRLCGEVRERLVIRVNRTATRYDGIAHCSIFPLMTYTRRHCDIA